MEARDSFCFPKKTKIRTHSYREKVRILLLWCTSRDSNLGPLIKSQLLYQLS